MKRPVFIVGCPRSGTTLLYSMLIAAGGFAAYRKETYFYDLLPRFPNLAQPSTQRQFLNEYLHGYLGKVPGLHVEPLVCEALGRCRCSAESLPLLMEAIAQVQQAVRFAPEANESAIG